MRGSASMRLREVFNGLRYVVKTGAPWRWMPHDLPPWAAVYQQAQRWLAAGCFEQLAEDLRAVLRLAAGRAPEPSAAILDSRTLRSSPESGERAGYDGAKRKKGSKVHWRWTRWATCWRCTSRPPTPTIAPRSGGWPRPCRRPPARASSWPIVDQGYTGREAGRGRPRRTASSWRWSRLPEAKRGFVLLPRRWVVERSFAWATRFRRLVKDYERYASTLADLHIVAFVCLMLKQAARLAASSL